MLEINVTVHIPGLSEAINNLASAICSSNSSVTPVVANTEKEPKPEQSSAPVVENPTTPAAPVQEAVVNTPPVQNNTVPANTAVSAPSAPSPSNATAYTIEQLSIAGAALCEQGKMPQLIALLGKYGVQAVTQLSGSAPDVINGFATELKALGANL